MNYRLQKASDHFFMLRHDIRYSWPDRLQCAIAKRAPRWLVYWVLMVAYAEAWQRAENKSPDELTFDEVTKPWEKLR